MATDSAECCPPGSFPALAAPADYAPKGAMVALDSPAGPLQAYVSGGGDAVTRGIIIAYDVYALQSGRIRGVADTLAAAGFLVVVPDIYEGSAVDLHGGFPTDTGKAFVKAQDWPKCQRYLDATHAYMAGRGVTSVGALGFCWGAWCVVHEAGTGRIAAGAGMHPSLGICGLHAEDPVDLLKAVKCPLMFLPASNDVPELKEGGEWIGLLNSSAHGATATEIPTVKHGFVTRGDEKDPVVAAAVQKALDMGIAFFNEKL